MTLTRIAPSRLSLLTSCLVAVGGGAAEAFELQTRLTFGIGVGKIEATPLIPDPDAAGDVESQRFLRVTAKFRRDAGPLRFSGQGRIALDDADDAPDGRETKAGAKATLDELNVSYAFGDAAILFLGRRNLSAGQSFGINPADVFLNESRLDRSLPSERRRSEIEGIDMIGTEFFFADGGAALAYWAPGVEPLNRDAPDRAYLSYRTTVGAAATDLTLFAFDDTAPGAGFSVAHPFDGGMILYGDTAFRHGRQLPDIRADGSVGARDADRWTIETTLGLSHAFDSGLTANIEYTHLSGGYDASEWKRFVNAIAANTPPADPMQGAAQAALSQIARADYLRRDYAFLRLHHPDLFGAGIGAEATVLSGLADGSGAVTLGMRMALSDASAFSASFGAAFGETNDEFRRGAERYSLGLFIETIF